MEQRRAARHREAVAPEVGRREPEEVVPRLRPRLRAAAAIARSIAAARDGLDQLAAHRSQRGVGDGRDPERPIPLSARTVGPSSAVAREARVEPGRVVVEREHEAGGRERSSRRRPHGTRPSRELRRELPRIRPGVRRARFRSGT